MLNSADEFYSAELFFVCTDFQNSNLMTLTVYLPIIRGANYALSALNLSWTNW